MIIKDEKTGYSFDTGVIEHISYPSSLRFGEIVEFKKKLIQKINATYKKSSEDPSFSPFLKSFGKTIVPSTIGQTEISEGKYILEELDNLRREIQGLRYDNKNSKLKQSLELDIKEVGLSKEDQANEHVKILKNSSRIIHCPKLSLEVLKLLQVKLVLCYRRLCVKITIEKKKNTYYRNTP